MIIPIFVSLLLFLVTATAEDRIAETRKPLIRMLGGLEDNVNHFRHIMHNHTLTDPQKFYQIAMSSSPITDKVKGVPYVTEKGISADHRYQEMYGTLLLPYVRQRHMLQKKIKFLEIGLGCTMNYGPGASARLWQKIFGDKDEIWEAEFNADCVENAKKNHLLDGINTVTGDQENAEVLKGWIEKTGGDFDIIVDDGGHLQDQIFASFMALWPTIKPGGLYFIEDLQVSRDLTIGARFRGARQSVAMQDYLYNWMEHLITFADLPSAPSIIKETPVPKNISWIFCEKEACVLAKCDDTGMAYCT